MPAVGFVDAIVMASVMGITPSWKHSIKTGNVKLQITVPHSFESAILCKPTHDRPRCQTRHAMPTSAPIIPT